MSAHPILLEARIYLDGVPVRLTASDWGTLPGGGFVYHVEFRSVEDPPRPIPVSETGYLSHFLMAGQTLGPEALRAYALDLGRGLVEAQNPGESAQPSLFC